MKKTIFFLFCLILFNRLSQAATNQRSDTFDIKHFGLHLNITDYTNQTISGFANIKVLSKMNNQNQIVFDLLNMNIDSILINSTIATLIITITLFTAADSAVPLTSNMDNKNRIRIAGKLTIPCLPNSSAYMPTVVFETSQGEWERAKGM